LFCRTCAETGQPVPQSGEGVGHLHIDAALYACVADAAVLDAGAEILFHAMPAAVQFVDGAWSLRLCTKTGLKDCRAKVIVDATGDANVVELAGLELIRSDVVQPATLSFSASGYDPNALDDEALKAASDKAIAEGGLLTTDIGWWSHNGPEALLRKRGHNANHVHAPDAHTSEGRSRAEIEGRKALLRVYRFLRAQPGLEKFQIDWVCPEIGIRETVTIKGKTTITVSDYESGVLYDDAICHAFYPIDEHLNDGRGINGRALKAGTLPSIPRGALLPADSQFLLVAGRCVSSDREAHSALRVECPCMAMGQAAGVLAVISARTGVDPEHISIGDVHALLRAHGAIVPECPSGAS